MRKNELQNHWKSIMQSYDSLEKSARRGEKQTVTRSLIEWVQDTIPTAKPDCHVRAAIQRRVFLTPWKSRCNLSYNLETRFRAAARTSRIYLYIALSDVQWSYGATGKSIPGRPRLWLYLYSFIYLREVIVITTVMKMVNVHPQTSNPVGKKCDSYCKRMKFRCLIAWELLWLAVAYFYPSLATSDCDNNSHEDGEYSPEDFCQRLEKSASHRKRMNVRYLI